MGNHRTLILEFPLPEAVSAVAYHPFGPSHITARWVTLLFFLGSTVFLFLFVRSITDRETARLAAVISMILPLAIFYSRAVHIDYGAWFSPTPWPGCGPKRSNETRHGSCGWVRFPPPSP